MELLTIKSNYMKLLQYTGCLLFAAFALAGCKDTPIGPGTMAPALPVQ